MALTAWNLFLDQPSFELEDSLVFGIKGMSQHNWLLAQFLITC